MIPSIFYLTTCDWLYYIEEVIAIDANKKKNTQAAPCLTLLRKALCGVKMEKLAELF